MVKILFDENFKKTFSKIKDSLLKRRIINQIEKIRKNPQIGKPMRFSRKGTRELYLSPFRLSYKLIIEEETIEILDLYHKKKQ